MSITTAPDRTEAAEYYFTYIDQVGDGDICRILDVQLAETLRLLQEIRKINRPIVTPPTSGPSEDLARTLSVASGADDAADRLYFLLST